MCTKNRIKALVLGIILMPSVMSLSAKTPVNFSEIEANQIGSENVSGDVLESMYQNTSISSEDKTPLQDYVDRYALLVKNLGVTGVGIETLIQRWEKDYPDNIDMLIAKFAYYLNKGRGTEIIQKPQKKYLGETPVLTLKDSLGNNINYFQEVVYSDSLFAIAGKAISKAMRIEPLRLDFRFSDLSALISYEKGSPDMALAKLIGLVDYNYQVKPKWEIPGMGEITNEDFNALIQEYCFAFFKMGTDDSYRAFKNLTDKMLDYAPKDPLFLNNLGSYYFVVAKEYKKALKAYNKVLKKNPKDYTAIKNCVLLARTKKDLKLERKYLPKLIKVTEDETEKMAAEARLQALNK